MALLFQQRQTYGQEMKTIGTGNYGKVILTDRNFAIKVTPNDEDNVVSPTTLKEIVSLMKVVSPYVIPLIDVILEENVTSLVLPLAQTTLKEVMTQPELDVKDIIRQACLGLADIHNANLLHLDLKPDNILLRGSGDDYKVWIADLGLSEMHTCALPPHSGEVFTLWYRAPEVSLGGPITTKADIWALGVTITELLISHHRKRRTYLFPGDSDRDQLYKIFRALGTPTKGSLVKLPGWELQRFPSWSPDLLYRLIGYDFSADEINFIEYILNPDYILRPSIFDILRHPWLQTISVPLQLTCWQSLEVYSHHPQDNWERSHLNRYDLIKEVINISHRLNVRHETLALTVYLLDRLVSLHPDLEQILLYLYACLFIAIYFYENPVPIISDILLHEKISLNIKEIQAAIVDILHQTSFDLAPTTSYHFLAALLEEKKGISLENAIKIWQVSLLVKYHFNQPQEVADIILKLVTPGHRSQNADGTEVLYLQIMSLPDDFLPVVEAKKILS